MLIDKETREFRGLWKRQYGISSVYNPKKAEWEAFSKDDRVWQEVHEDDELGAVNEDADHAHSADDDSDAALGLPAYGSDGDGSRDDWQYLGPPLQVVSADGRVAGDDDTQAQEVALV